MPYKFPKEVFIRIINSNSEFNGLLKLDNPTK